MGLHLIYTIKKKNTQFILMPYYMYTIVVLLGTQAGTYCCRSLGPD